MGFIEQTLFQLKQSGAYRTIKTPQYSRDIEGKIDLSSNDYLGISLRNDWVAEFLSQYDAGHVPQMTSVASRLLSVRQDDFFDLEQLLSDLYGRSAIVYNSGYHANTGVISALGGKNVLFIADKLVHASIIDGLVLSRSQFLRFRHNDMQHLERLLRENAHKYSDVVIVTESVFSMDGDMCDLQRLVELKRQYSNVMLYVDEAHGFGVFGERGLGCAEELSLINDIDFIIGTLGKAAASSGAFVITSVQSKEYLINRSRSLIFSTAIPPVCCAWSAFVIRRMVGMQSEREHLQYISRMLQQYTASQSTSQIIPLIVGSNDKALEKSEQLLNLGFVALPIRAPTVPLGTERVRFSLNAALSKGDINRLISALKTI